MDLSQNKITDVGAMGFARGMGQNKSVQELDLSMGWEIVVGENAIQDEGAMELSAVVKGHKALTEFSIGTLRRLCGSRLELCGRRGGEGGGGGGDREPEHEVAGDM